METARPPASSLEVTMRRPLESRERLFWRASLAFPRLRPAPLAAGLTLIEIIMIFLGCDPILGQVSLRKMESKLRAKLVFKERVEKMTTEDTESTEGVVN
jgi:hypothetical protein